MCISLACDGQLLLLLQCSLSYVVQCTRAFSIASHQYATLGCKVLTWSTRQKPHLRLLQQRRAGADVRHALRHGRGRDRLALQQLPAHRQLLQRRCGNRHHAARHPKACGSATGPSGLAGIQECTSLPVQCHGERHLAEGLSQRLAVQRGPACCRCRSGEDSRNC